MQRQSRVEGANAKAKKFGWPGIGVRENCASVWKRRAGCAITRATLRENTSVLVLVLVLVSRSVF
jgi:hypothetical protein